MVTFTLTDKQLEELEAKRNELQVAVNNEQLALERLTKERVTLESDVNKLHETIATLNEDVDATGEEKRSIENETDAVEGYLTEKQAEVKKAKDELDLIISKVGVATVELADLEIEKQALADRFAAEKSTRDEELINMRGELNHIEGLIASAKDELKNTADAKRAVDESVKTAQEQYEAIVAESEEITAASRKKLSDTADTLVSQEKLIKDNEDTIYGLQAKKEEVALAITEAENKLWGVNQELLSKVKEIDEHREAAEVLARREEKMRDFCDRHGIDHTNF